MEYSHLEEAIASYSIQATITASAVLFLLIITSLLIKKPKPLSKIILFAAMSIVTVATTIFLTGATVYLNTVSVSKGPVHYHTDFEIWTCGEEIELINPKGFSNKIGTSTLHEHNDKRVHLEGVVVEEKDASLGKFMKVVGGNISNDNLTFPTNNGLKSFNSGETCPNGEEAFVQVFVYNVEGKNYYQRKLNNPQDYIIAPQTQVPPGDCIIIEFDKLKDKTDKLCLSFEAAKLTGKLGEEI